MITVNFRGFRNIVDKLGGVYMDVDRRYFNDNSGAGRTYATINLKPGYQKLDGREALDFVRFRHTDSDLYRVVRQQEFVKAVKQRVSSTWDVFQLPGIVKAITENIEVAKGGGKLDQLGEVLGYANARSTASPPATSSRCRSTASPATTSSHSTRPRSATPSATS